MIEFDAHELAISAVDTLHRYASDLTNDVVDSSYGTAMNAVLAASLAAYSAAGMTPAGLMVAAGWGLNHLAEADLIERPETDAVTIACILAMARQHDVDTDTLVYCIDHEGAIPEALLEEMTCQIAARLAPVPAMPALPPVELGTPKQRTKMTTKTPPLGAEITTTLRPDVDSPALRLRGWDLRNLEVTLTSRSFGNGEYSHTIQLSGTHHFRRPRRDTSFGTLDGWPAPVVAIVTATKISGYPCSFRAFYPDYDNLGVTHQFTSKAMIFDTYQPLDHGDVKIEITSYDAYDGGLSNIPLDPVIIPLSVENNSTQEGIRFELGFAKVLMHRSQTDLNDINGNVIITGSLRVKGLRDLWSDFKNQSIYVDEDESIESYAPFEVRTPTFEIEFVDADGSYLWSEELDLDMAVPVDELCHKPTRDAAWFVDKEYDPSHFLSSPARAVLRITDPL